MRIVSCLLLSAGLLHAAEPETAAEWIESLSETYRKQGGYIVTYHSQGENKSLDATLATDSGSGMAVLHLTATKAGQRMEHRQWSDRPGDMFIDVNGKRGHVLGLKEEVKVLCDIFSDTTGKTGIPAYTPGLLLTKESVSASLGFTMPPEPGWKDEAEGAKLGEVTEKSVVIVTGAHGDLTISRESGMMIRQSVTGDSGEKRVLEMVHYRRNPGQEDIISLSRDWQTAGAVPMGAEMLRSTRSSFFQSAIRAVDSDHLTLEQLKEKLDSRKDQLGAFATLCSRSNPESRLATMDWKGVARQAKTTVHEAWEKKLPEAERNEKDFETLWNRDGKKAAVGFLEKFSQDKDVRRSTLGDILGPGVELKATTKGGENARDFMESTLCHAYLEVIVRDKLVPHLEPQEKAE